MENQLNAVPLMPIKCLKISYRLFMVDVELKNRNQYQESYSIVRNTLNLFLIHNKKTKTNQPKTKPKKCNFDLWRVVFSVLNLFSPFVTNVFLTGNE